MEVHDSIYIINRIVLSRNLTKPKHTKKQSGSYGEETIKVLIVGK